MINEFEYRGVVLLVEQFDDIFIISPRDFKEQCQFQVDDACMLTAIKKASSRIDSFIEMYGDLEDIIIKLEPILVKPDAYTRRRLLDYSVDNMLTEREVVEMALEDFLHRDN